MGSTDLNEHFAFGENWQSYAATVSERHLESAREGLLELFDKDMLAGSEVLDIGCGSGLHAVAAATLGAKVLAVDLDPVCVKTTAALINRFDVGSRVEVRELSAFELSDAELPTFDVVYSWGVLHHTGAMWDAIACGAERVRDGGLYALAIYRRTRFCPLWRVEKRIYKSLPKFGQQVVKCAYVSIADVMHMLKRGKLPHQRRREYYRKRGMSLGHDAHDWLGGFPYESANLQELEAAMSHLGFELINSHDARGGRLALGIMGTGCGQYLFRKSQCGSSSISD